MDTYIALGYACNHSCICCPLTTFDRLHSQLSVEELQAKISLLLEGASTSIEQNVVLSGGEPFLHPAFYDLLKKLLGASINITVLTNATQLATPSAQAKISEIIMFQQEKRPRLQIVTAVHSSDNAIHDRITGCEGSLWDAIKGLDFAVKSNLDVTVKVILSKANAETLVDTIAYLDEHFPAHVAIQFCGMDYSGRAARNLDKLLISFAEIQEKLEAALDYLVKKNKMRLQKNKPVRKVSIIELPLCSCDPYYWRFFSMPLQEQKQYVAPNDAARKMHTLSTASAQCGCFYEECQGCAAKRYCSGTWKSTYRFVNNCLRPFTEESKNV